MAVQAPAKPKPVDDFDDDEPLVFKRPNQSSKQNQLNSVVKKALSQKPDGQSGRQISDRVSLNGLNSSSQKGKVVQSNKASGVKSTIASPKASTSLAKASPVKSPVTNSKTSTSLDGQSKFLSDKNKCSGVKEQNSSIKQPIRSDSHSEDSEDDIPLSYRIKGNTSQGSKGFGKPSTGLTLQPIRKSIVKESREDSDDEPLSSRFQMKTNVGTSSSKANDCDDKKPLLSINKQNGSTTTDVKKPLNTNTKRPLEREISEQSSVKKPKLSDSPALLKNKQVTVKAESKADDDDHVPISQRIKKSPASNNKLSTPKQKVTKPVSSSVKKTTKKFKKVAKKSKYSKSTKLSPSSGDGQKKWTTLVHNGVIFPPPYQAHGIKMLYNGKPIDLTPEQEEVLFLSNISFICYISYKLIRIFQIPTLLLLVYFICYICLAGCNNVCSYERHRLRGEKNV